MNKAAVHGSRRNSTQDSLEALCQEQGQIGLFFPSCPGLAVPSVTLGPGLPCSAVSVLSTDQQPLLTGARTLTAPELWPLYRFHQWKCWSLQNLFKCPFGVPGDVSHSPTLSSELVHLTVFFQDSSFPHQKIKPKYSVPGPWADGTTFKWHRPTVTPSSYCLSQKGTAPD